MKDMDKFRTVVSVIIMIVAAVAGFFIGAFLESAFGGAILFSVIAGFACLIYATDNKNE